MKLVATTSELPIVIEKGNLRSIDDPRPDKKQVFWELDGYAYNRAPAPSGFIVVIDLDKPADFLPGHNSSHLI